MELVTVTDFFFTASLALLLSFLVAKLVSLATTDTHTATKPVGPVHQVEQRLTLQTPQTETRVGFINPVQVKTTNLETGYYTEDVTVDHDSNVAVEFPTVNSNIVVTEENKGDATVDSDSKEETVLEEITEENCTEKLVSVDDDWEWEGIERSEIEKKFMEAMEFVGEKGYIGNCDGDDDVEMELYGLQKVAMEGPCREPQPMPLKLSARAKWNAWQKLGNMSPEVAMERYISLLSDKVPGWVKDTSAGMTEGEPTGSEVSESTVPDFSSALSHQQMILPERELVQESGVQELIPLTVSDLENNVKK